MSYIYSKWQKYLIKDKVDQGDHMFNVSSLPIKTLPASVDFKSKCLIEYNQLQKSSCTAMLMYLLKLCYCKNLIYFYPELFYIIKKEVLKKLFLVILVLL